MAWQLSLIVCSTGGYCRSTGAPYIQLVDIDCCQYGQAVLIRVVLTVYLGNESIKIWSRD